MKDIIMALATVLFIDVLLFFAQTGMTELNPGGVQIYTYQDSLLSRYDAGGYTLNQSTTEEFPSSTNTVSVQAGDNFFTDIFASIKNWVIDTVPGAKYVVGVIDAVPNMLKSFGLPKEMSFGLGAIWHGIVFMMALMFFKS